MLKVKLYFLKAALMILVAHIFNSRKVNCLVLQISIMTVNHNNAFY